MLIAYMLPLGPDLAFSVYRYLPSLHVNHHHEHISIRLVWNAQTLLRGMKEAFRQCKVWLQPIKNRLKMGMHFYFFTSRKVRIICLWPTEMGRLITQDVVHQDELIKLV